MVVVRRHLGTEPGAFYPLCLLLFFLQSKQHLTMYVLDDIPGYIDCAYVHTSRSSRRPAQPTQPRLRALQDDISSATSEWESLTASPFSFQDFHPSDAAVGNRGVRKLSPPPRRRWMAFPDLGPDQPERGRRPGAERSHPSPPPLHTHTHFFSKDFQVRGAGYEMYDLVHVVLTRSRLAVAGCVHLTPFSQPS